MKVKFYANCAFAGTQQISIEEYPDDVTDEVLEQDAEQIMFDTIQPEFWYKKLPDDYDEDEDDE